MNLIGYDIGSSSIKATLLAAETGQIIASASSPKTELEIMAPKPGWAEQHPEVWWQHVKLVTAEIKSQAGRELDLVQAIGISYQMHGLVLVNNRQEVLRPAIIWCDSRAVAIGAAAFKALGRDLCLVRLLNSPGNFTAAKLKWIMANEPALYQQVDKFMLPGDFIAMKMTGEIQTTPSGLSEGILWDFHDQEPADLVLGHFGISKSLMPTVVPTFSIQGQLTPKAAAELGLPPGARVAYRAGDQPNNAFSLNVLHPGQIAATAGTSGVVYGVGDQANFDPESRVNTFVHVNHQPERPRYGVLLCINGTGILNSWLRHNLIGAAAQELSYEQMNQAAAQAPVGADGLFFLPYGNGAERSLGNKEIGAFLAGLSLNRHNRSHLLRAAQEGIVFAFHYGMGILHDMGVAISQVRAGHANMFLSPLFTEAFASLSGATVELYRTDGSQGAARGAGLGSGIYPDAKAAFVGLHLVGVVEPNIKNAPRYQDAYQNWENILKAQLERL